MSRCDTSAIGKILDVLKPTPGNARKEAGDLVKIVQEARSVIVSDNLNNPQFATSEFDKLGNGTITNEGTVGSALSMRGAYVLGLRNRLFLKYMGIDYEFYNVHDIRYRGE